MRVRFVTKEAVTLDGFQAIMKPGEHGYVAQAIINDEEMQERVEKDAEDKIQWVSTKAKDPNRTKRNKLPWKPVEEGLLYKFSWNVDDEQPVVYDSEGTTITDKSLPLYEGSRVKLGVESWSDADY